MVDQVKSITKSLPKMLVYFAVYLLLVLGVSWLISIRYPDSTQEVIIISLLYLALSVKSVDAEHIALLVRFGTLQERKIYTNGYFIAFFLIDKMVVYPTEQIRIKIEKHKMTTKAGKFDGIDCDAVMIDIESTFTFFWPTQKYEDLKEAYIRGPDPGNQDKVADFFEATVVAAEATATSQFTWLEVQRRSQRFLDEIKKELKMGNENPVKISRIEKIGLQIDLVSLPEGLGTALNKRQLASYNYEAAKVDSESAKYKLTKEGEGNAAATKSQLEALETHPEAAKLYTLSRMAEGQASTIFYSLPFELQKTTTIPEISDAIDKLKDQDFSKILSGQDPKLPNIFNALTNDQKKEVIQKLIKAAQNQGQEQELEPKESKWESKIKPRNK